jgi:hypothetical protein
MLRGLLCCCRRCFEERARLRATEPQTTVTGECSNDERGLRLADADGSSWVGWDVAVSLAGVCV